MSHVPMKSVHVLAIAKVLEELATETKGRPMREFLCQHERAVVFRNAGTDQAFMMDADGEFYDVTSEVGLDVYSVSWNTKAQRPALLAAPYRTDEVAAFLAENSMSAIMVQETLFLNFAKIAAEIEQGVGRSTLGVVTVEGKRFSFASSTGLGLVQIGGRYVLVKFSCPNKTNPPSGEGTVICSDPVVIDLIRKARLTLNGAVVHEGRLISG